MKNTKGKAIILCSRNATRLQKTGKPRKIKSFCRINKIPVVIHIVNSIIQSEEFDEIFIIYNRLYKKKHFKIIKNYIENLKNNELKLKFILQKEILGTAHATKITLESGLNNIESEDKIAIFLGDTTFVTVENIKNTMRILSNEKTHCLVNLYNIKKPNKHGKAIFDEHNNLKEVVEYKEYLNNEEIKNLTICCGGILQQKTPFL